MGQEGAESELGTGALRELPARAKLILSNFQILAQTLWAPDFCFVLFWGQNPVLFRPPEQDKV